MLLRMEVQFVIEQLRIHSTGFLNWRRDVVVVCATVTEHPMVMTSASSKIVDLFEAEVRMQQIFVHLVVELSLHFLHEFHLHVLIFGIEPGNEKEFVAAQNVLLLEFEPFLNRIYLILLQSE